MRATLHLRFILAAVSMAAAVACNSRDGDAGGQRSAAGRVGVVLPALGHPGYRALESQLKEALEERDQQLVVEGANNDPERQRQLVETFTAQKARALVIVPLDGTTLRGAIDAAGNANIPVFTVGLPVPGARVTTHLDPDFHAAGVVAAEYVGAFLGPRLRAAVLGRLGAHGSRDMEAGFRSTLGSVQTRVVSASAESRGTRAGAAEATAALLQGDPNLDAIFALDPETAQGAMDAAYARRRADLVIVAFGATDETFSAIRESRPLRAAIIERLDEAARLLAETIGTQLEGEPVTSALKVPVRLVNVDSLQR